MGRSNMPGYLDARGAWLPVPMRSNSSLRWTVATTARAWTGQWTGDRLARKVFKPCIRGWFKLIIRISFTFAAFTLSSFNDRSSSSSCASQPLPHSCSPSQLSPRLPFPPRPNAVRQRPNERITSSSTMKRVLSTERRR